jgi:hypothetical protein
MSATTGGKKSRGAAYDRVIAVLGALRMQGRLGWHMVLDLTRELVEWETFRSPREARASMPRRAVKCELAEKSGSRPSFSRLASRFSGFLILRSCTDHRSR